MENLYKFYSLTVAKPMLFEDFVDNFHPKWKWAYQRGIVDAAHQLALIDYHHKPEADYDFGFGNGIKAAMAIMAGESVELIKPKLDLGGAKEIESLKKANASLKGQITKLKKDRKGK